MTACPWPMVLLLEDFGWRIVRPTEHGAWMWHE